jgi:hypothetical protein
MVGPFSPSEAEHLAHHSHSSALSSSAPLTLPPSRSLRLPSHYGCPQYEYPQEIVGEGWSNGAFFHYDRSASAAQLAKCPEVRYGVWCFCCYDCCRHRCTSAVAAATAPAPATAAAALLLLLLFLLATAALLLLSLRLPSLPRRVHRACNEHHPTPGVVAPNPDLSLA